LKKRLSGQYSLGILSTRKFREGNRRSKVTEKRGRGKRRQEGQGVILKRKDLGKRREKGNEELNKRKGEFGGAICMLTGARISFEKRGRGQVKKTRREKLKGDISKGEIQEDWVI